MASNRRLSDAEHKAAIADLDNMWGSTSVNVSFVDGEEIVGTWDHIEEAPYTTAYGVPNLLVFKGISGTYANFKTGEIGTIIPNEAYHIPLFHEVLKGELRKWHAQKPIEEGERFAIRRLPGGKVESKNDQSYYIYQVVFPDREPLTQKRVSLDSL